MTSPQPDPTAAPAPFTPEQFGKYVLVDRIATGGMAEIFRAKSFSHGGFESELVIKRILPHIGENEEFIEMFQDEAKVSVALQHPNIVRIFDFGRVQSGNTAHWYIVMECVDGKDVRNLLRKLSRRREFMPPEFAAFIALESCKGLHYAHVKTDPKGNPYGIVHRDISPSNILVSYEGEVKVADFGIAKAQSNAYQTKDGVLKGKFEYMSPEQAQGVPFDARSDLFSLGIQLYETMTGRRLFRTESETATLTKVREAIVEPPDQLKSDLPPRLVQICMKALSKDPADRYPDAQAMEADLREFLFPETSDTLRRRFREYLQLVFAEEIAAERAKLESVDPQVKVIKERILAEWESQHEGTMNVTRTRAGAAMPLLGAIGFGAFGILAVLLGVGVIAALTMPQLWQDDQVVETTGSLDIVVFPETAKVTIDGAVHEGTEFTLGGLEPGTHLVRIEAEGYVPVEVTAKVVAGRAERVSKSLDPVAAPVDPGKPPAPSGPPSIDFKSTPAGAAVFVEGQQVCDKTPCTWTGAPLGGTVVAEFRLGDESARATLKDVQPGSQKLAATMPSAAGGTARVTVKLTGVAWAHLYVDGVKQAKTAPGAFELKPGKHELKFVNEAAGFTKTETKTIAAGTSSITIGR